jgi:hypothetical protein
VKPGAFRNMRNSWRKSRSKVSMASTIKPIAAMS